MDKEEIQENNKAVREIQSFRMLQEALFFINSIGRQEQFLNYVSKADRDLYLSV